ncbi:MAG: Bax inhibitor-1 family protein [Flavobacteriaceae bacterium]|nr:Bax inhibitor-1 family protein [Flavobacteriaceae bacterium]
MENYIQVSSISEVERVEFYKKTYTHVAFGVLAFIVVEYLMLSSEFLVRIALSLSQGKMWLLMLGGFMIATTYAERMAIKSHDRNKQYLGYLIYIIAQAFIFIPMIYMAMSMTDGPNLIKQAAVLTLSLFTGLSAVVLFTKKDFSFMKRFLTIGFFIALGLVVAGVLFGFNLGLWFSVGMIILAAGSILYQTSNLVNQYSTDQYVSAAIGLFASLMLLFWYILSIFLSRD